MDLVGKRYGKLLVKEFDHKDKYNHSHYKCLCECGKETIVRDNSLTLGKTQSCGCYRNQRVSETQSGVKRHTDLSNRRFGMLSVIELLHVKDGRTYWKCLCDCGNESIVRGNDLTKKKGIKSCGCYRNYLASLPKSLETRAKLSKHRSEESRKKMSESRKGRFMGCNNPNWKGGVPKNVHSAKRRAIKYNQYKTLPECEKDKVRLYYRIKQYLGLDWEVDHIKPLSKGGLHHPDNLWIIPSIDNNRKRNKLDYVLNHDFYFKL